MSTQPEPQWQPITQLALLASIVDGIWANTEEQHQTFTAVKDKPHVLDDALVQRAIRLYQAQLDDLWLYAEQFARWQKESLTDSQRQEVNRLVSQLPRIRARSEAILALLDEIKAGTINRILEKSDLELGLEYLLRNRKR